MKESSVPACPSSAPNHTWRVPGSSSLGPSWTIASPMHVAVERGRGLEVAADRRDVVKPPQLHAPLVAHPRQPSGPTDQRNDGPPERRRKAVRKAQKPATKTTTAPPATAIHGRAREVQRAGGEHRGQAGQHARVRAEAGEVLAQHGVEPAQRGEHEPAQQREPAAVGVEPDDHADHEQDDPDEHAQLDERERVPRRLRPLVGQRARGGGPARGAAAAAGAGDAARRARLRRPISGELPTDVRWLTGSPRRS